jgi:ERCC4-related helicase
MQYQTIVGKFNEYLHSAGSELLRWLDKLLPKIKNNWWEDCVVDKLSYDQQQKVSKNKITTLKDLDPYALLRIAHKNWYDLWQMQRCSSLRQSLKSVLKDDMPAVRNFWAHPSVSPPKTDKIIKDLETIVNFFSLFNDENKVISDVKKTLQLIKSEGIEEKPIVHQVIEKKKTEKITSPLDITKNTVVRLTSDKNIKGVVMDIQENGGAKQFNVFINGKIETFFASQIEAEFLDRAPKITDISDIIRKLTAYQIKQPSSESLYSLNAARVDFVPYQFRPALKIIKSDTHRLLIADGVGVGKTIEAGLILKELQARKPLENVLIICPKPLVVEKKWEDEMRKKFDEKFVSVDGNTLRNIIVEANRDGIWPDTYKRLILPYSLLTKDLLEGQQQKRKKILGLENLSLDKFFDLIIVDEAHHIRNSATQAYKAVKFFCDRATAAIFMTATPIQLGNEDLFTLLNLLFPSIVRSKAAFEAMAGPNPYINLALSYLRQRNDLSNVQIALDNAANTEWGRVIIAKNPKYHQIKEQLSCGELTRENRVKMINDIESLHSFYNMINRTRRQDIEDFCVRKAHTLKSVFTEHQRELHDSLLEFKATALKMLHGNMPIKFLMSTISRQAASCIFGLAPTLRAFTEKQLDQITDEYDCDEEIDINDNEIKSLKPLAEKIIHLAENLPSEDPKFDSLVQFLRDKQKYEKNKIIIFSTFRHTLSYLKKRIIELGLRVEQINGSVDDDERRRLRECFMLPKDNSQALDILLFTEVGSEGLDYQFCDAIVNYDLPWNPMRIEQRIGRIDRRKQESEVVHIYNCITDGTIDAEIYERCLLRIGVFEQSIGECSEILGKIASSIQEIAFDVELTESERAMKLEHLADNEVGRMLEMQRLENEQKKMFGLDVSNFTEAVEMAENPWIDSTSLKSLILGYLHERLNSDRKYINDKRLSLTMSEKEELRKDFKLIKGNPEDSWARFLRNVNDTSCKIVFEQDDAEDHQALFITPVHPLVRQAADYVEKKDTGEMRTALKITSSAIASGEYPFLLFSWKYKGSHTRVELVAICANEAAQAELPAVIKSAVQIEVQFDKFERYWNELDIKHHKKWESELDNFQEDMRKNCRFKLESLEKTFIANTKAAEQQLEQASDSKIIIMKRSEIERLKTNYKDEKSILEKTVENTDIITTKLVSGVLIVEEE